MGVHVQGEGLPEPAAGGHRLPRPRERVRVGRGRDLRACGRRGGGIAGDPVLGRVDNHLYVLKADDSLLLESSTFNFRYEEVLGPESIRLGVWGYAAPVIGRYPLGIAKVDAGTTIPAPAEVETTEAPAAEGESKAKKA